MILLVLIQFKLDSLYSAATIQLYDNIEIYNSRFSKLKTDSIFIELPTVDLFVFNCLFSSCLGNKRMSWENELIFMPPAIAANCSNVYISKISIYDCNSTSCCIICTRGDRQQINHTSVNQAKHNAFTIMPNYGNPSTSFCNTSNIVTTQRESAIHNGYRPQTYSISYINIHEHQGFTAIGSGHKSSKEQINSHINIIKSSFSAGLINNLGDYSPHLYDYLCIVNCTAPTLIKSATTNIRFTKRME